MASHGKPRIIGPQMWRLVAAELDAGSTYEQVQAELARANPPITISIHTLHRYRAEDNRKARAGKLPEDHSSTLERLQARVDARRGCSPSPDAAPAAPMPDGADLEVLLQRLIQDAGERLERARSLGDARTAASESKNLAELTSQLGRAQKSKASLRDVLTFTRAGIEGGMRSVREKVAAIVQRPLMCAGCARELAAALTGVDLSPPAPAAEA